MPLILNFVYVVVLLLASPILLYRRFVHGKYRDGFTEKFLGRLPFPEETGRPRIWFHAVSVGEVLQLVTVVRELLARRADVDIVITTTTSTGLAVAKEKFPEHHVCYFPLDFTWAVRNAVERIRPDAVVLVELELWPNFVREVHAREIPLLLINGRISEKSFNGYRKLRFLMRSVLAKFDSLAVQNETYADRLRQLGAPPERITVTGSIKFDAIAGERDNPATTELRRAFEIGDDETVFIAGSTHAPEEEIALSVWERLREEFPNLRLILVPRHQERFEEVAALVQSRGLGLVRRSEVRGQQSEDKGQRSGVRSDGAAGGNGRSGSDTGRSTISVQSTQYSVQSTKYKVPNTASGALRPTSAPLVSHATNHQSPVTSYQSPPHPVPPCLLDTLGELSACWGLADIAFVGGSLTSRGGQNMIEPAGYGAAVLFGPNTRNFRDVVEMLLDGDAARVVADAEELIEAVRELLADREQRVALGTRARQLVLSQRGATSRTVDIIDAVFDDVPASTVAA